MQYLQQNYIRRFASDTTAAAARLLCGTIRQAELDLNTIAPRVFYANHTSHLDYVIIWATLPPILRELTRPVVARDYWYKTQFRRFLSEELCGAIYVDRGKTTRANNPLREVEKAVHGGHSIVVFPEGNRGSGRSEIRPFKSGLYHIAKRCPEAEIVPVYLENLNRILPKGEFLVVPLLSVVRYGKPLRIEPGESKIKFLERARVGIEELVK